MEIFFKRIRPLIQILNVIVIFSLLGGVYYLYVRTDQLEEKVNLIRQNKVYVKKVDNDEKPTISVDCSNECLRQIDKAVSSAVSTVSATTKVEKVVETKAVAIESGGTDFIPMGTTSTTTNTDWTTLEETAVYIDLENDYSKDASVSWEASLKVAHGNGQAFARLWDDTNKIAVDFSELSTSDNDSFKRVSSPNLPFWRGRNLYKVQIKSLNSFEVTYGGGKMRISY